MDQSELISKIDGLIRDALNHRYNKQATAQMFIVSEQTQCFKIVNHSGQFELSVLDEQPFLMIAYRLPQSRMFYTVFQNLKWKISFIDYFNHTIVILQNKHKAATVTFKKKNKISGIRLINGRKIVPGTLKVKEEVWWFKPKNNGTKFKSALHFLNETLQREYRIHPLQTFTITDNILLRKIDSLFCTLNFILPNGTIHLNALKSEKFIWLHELYLQLGWYDRLLLFYKKIAQKADVIFKNEIPALLLKRFTAFTVAQDIKISLRLKNFTEEKLWPANDSFFRMYLDVSSEWSSAQLEKLQQFWEYFQLNVLQLKWQRDFTQNPKEFMAFALLAIRHKFWWAPQAVNLVKTYLPQEQKPLFELLSIVLFAVNITVENETLKIGSMKTPNTLHELKNSGLKVSYRRFGKQVFSAIKVPSAGLDFRINQHVEFLLNLTLKTIQINPMLLRPPLKPLKFRFITLKAGAFILHLPLVWEQFYLELNGLRIKWLRKKRRFQISVKNPNFEMPIKIAGNMVSFRNDRYAKIYLPILREESQTNLQAFTLNGRQVEKLPVNEKEFTLRGISLSVFGILKEFCNVYLNNQRKNRVIATNDFIPQKLTTGILPAKIRCLCRQCKSFLMNIEKRDGFWNSFSKMPAAWHLQRTKLWLDENEKQNLPLLKALCLDRLGFIPEIRVIPIRKFRPLNETFNFLISTNYTLNDEFVARLGEIEIYKRLKTPKTKYFFLKSEFLSDYFGFQFFIQNGVKK